MDSQFRAPDEVELLEFIGADAVERNVEDGAWSYEVTDKRGVTLRFSFNLYKRSVQTAVSLGGSRIATVSHESADRIRALGLSWAKASALMLAQALNARLRTERPLHERNSERQLTKHELRLEPEHAIAGASERAASAQLQPSSFWSDSSCPPCARRRWPHRNPGPKRSQFFGRELP
jgi:hypothetical protein